MFGTKKIPFFDDWRAVGRKCLRGKEKYLLGNAGKTESCEIGLYTATMRPIEETSINKNRQTVAPIIGGRDKKIRPLTAQWRCSAD